MRQANSIFQSVTISAFAGEGRPDALDAAPSIEALLRAVLRRIAHGHVQLAVDTCGRRSFTHYVLRQKELVFAKEGYFGQNIITLSAPNFGQNDPVSPETDR